MKNKGQFQKGADPRRHKFTSEECSKGFWKAIESIVTQHSEKVYPDGRHIAVNFLKPVSRKRAEAAR